MGKRERIDHDEAYRDDPGFTAPEMQPGHGEERPPLEEAEGGAGAAALAGGVGGVILAGELERGELDERQDVARGRENRDQGVDSVR